MALGLPTHDEDERNRRYAVAADGRRYLTTAPSLAEPVPATKASRFHPKETLATLPSECSDDETLSLAALRGHFK
jgi:hypothetical protein